MSAPKPHLHEVGEVQLATENHIQYQGKFLIHRRGASKDFGGFLLGPGGRIDQGEDVVVSAAREILEETGITVPAESVKLKAVGLHHGLGRGEIWVNFITLSKLKAKPSVIAPSAGRSARSHRSTLRPRGDQAIIASPTPPRRRGFNYGRYTLRSASFMAP